MKRGPRRGLTCLTFEHVNGKGFAIRREFSLFNSEAAKINEVSE